MTQMFNIMVMLESGDQVLFFEREILPKLNEIITDQGGNKVKILNTKSPRLEARLFTNLEEQRHSKDLSIAVQAEFTIKNMKDWHFFDGKLLTDPLDLVRIGP